MINYNCYMYFPLSWIYYHNLVQKKINKSNHHNIDIFKSLIIRISVKEIMLHCCNIPDICVVLLLKKCEFTGLKN